MQAIIGAIVIALGAAAAQPAAAQGAIAGGKVERPDTAAHGIFSDLDRLVGPVAGDGGVFTPQAADGRGGGQVFDTSAAGDPSNTTLLSGSVGRMKYHLGPWGLRAEDRFFTGSRYGSRYSAPMFLGQDPRQGDRLFGGFVLAYRP